MTIIYNAISLDYFFQMSLISITGGGALTCICIYTVTYITTYTTKNKKGLYICRL